MASRAAHPVGSLEGVSAHSMTLFRRRSDIPALYARDMATIFTKIIDGELPGAFVYRDERSVAFLSINPLTTGHTLVVPIEEVDHWVDCPQSLRDHLMAVATAVAQAQMKVWSPQRIGLIVAGFEVPHLHLHVFPSWGMGDFDFAKVAPMQSMDVLEPTAARIRQELEL